jgi:DNA-binding NarL/FixJ family response regulator
MGYLFKEIWSDEGIEKDKMESNVNVKLFFESLSARQGLILNLRNQGYEIKEIALRVGLSPRTIQNDMKEIKKRFKVRFC